MYEDGTRGAKCKFDLFALDPQKFNIASSSSSSLCTSTTASSSSASCSSSTTSSSSSSPTNTSASSSAILRTSTNKNNNNKLSTGSSIEVKVRRPPSVTTDFKFRTLQTFVHPGTQEEGYFVYKRPSVIDFKPKNYRI